MGAGMVARTLKWGVLAAALLLAATVSSALAHQQVAEVEEVLERLEAALNRRDVEGAVALFASQASGEIDGRRVGARGLRRWVETHAAENTHIHLGGYAANESRVTWIAEIGEDDWWRQGDPKRRVSGSAAVRDGRIALFTFGDSTSVPVATASEAGLMGTGAPLSGLVAVLPVLAVAAGWLLLRRRSGHDSGYQPEPAAAGPLVSALGQWAERRSDVSRRSTRT